MVLQYVVHKIDRRDFFHLYKGSMSCVKHIWKLKELKLLKRTKTPTVSKVTSSLSANTALQKVPKKMQRHLILCMLN